MDEFVKHIIKVDNDDRLFFEYLKESPYNDGKPSKYMDDKRLMKRFEEIFG